MKLNKKKVFLAALAVCLVAIISMGTLAWFSDSDVVENDFLIADTNHPTEDDIFNIDIWEINPDGAVDEDGYEYKDVLPGDKLKKDVFVKNTGYYDQYVRVIVTISDVQTWIAALGANADVAAIFDGFDASLWDIDNNLRLDPTASDLVYVMYYKNVLREDEVINVFNNILIPDSLEQDQVVGFGNHFSIDVRAQAVQTRNVVDLNNIPAGKTAAEVAFETVGMTIDQ